MRFEWDEAKNRRNLAKHKIGFETAKLVFEDLPALSFHGPTVNDETGGKLSESSAAWL